MLKNGSNQQQNECPTSSSLDSRQKKLENCLNYIRKELTDLENLIDK